MSEDSNASPVKPLARQMLNLAEGRSGGMTDWAMSKALDILAARKLTTKIVHDDDDTPFATIVADNSAVLIAEALREERERWTQPGDKA
jgi:hypothetical protein